MSIFLLFILLCVSNVSSNETYKDFFKYIGLDTQCGGNTTYNYSTDCSIRCDNLNSTPKECTRLPYYGCTCKGGYIPLNTIHTPLVCLKVEDCPKNLTNTDCSGNTTFGSIPYFTKVCDLKNYKYMVNRTRYFGCICKDGYIPQNYPFPSTCVKEGECPNTPKVVYTGLQPSGPSDTPPNYDGSLSELKNEYGLKGPYNSNVTATTAAPQSPTSSPATSNNQTATTSEVSLTTNNQTATTAGESLTTNNQTPTTAGVSLNTNSQTATTAGGSLTTSNQTPTTAGGSLTTNNQTATTAGGSSTSNA